MITITEKETFIVSLTRELYRIFDLLNEKYFENKLEYPIIVVQSKKRKRTMGTCSVDRIWIDRKDDKLSKYEITLSAEYLNRPTQEVVGTLLHEMVHLYCSLNDIKDTSNNYVYHNKKFKEESEKRGLLVEKGVTVGWSYTKLNEAAEELVKTFNIDEAKFEYYRYSLKPSDILPTKPITTRNKYQCDCGIKISSTKELNISCDDCKQPFKKVTGAKNV